MRQDTRQALKTALVAAICVAVLTMLAWWSVVGMVLVGLSAMLGLGVGWSLGYRQAQVQEEQARPARRHPTPEPRREGRKQPATPRLKGRGLSK